MVFVIRCYGLEMGKVRAIEEKNLEQRGCLATSYAATSEVPSRFGRWAAGKSIFCGMGKSESGMG